MRDPEKEERNEKIFDIWLNERVGFSDLAKRFDLSPGRIKTIIVKHSWKLRFENKQLKKLVQHQKDMTAHVEAHIEAHDGETIDSQGIPDLSIRYLDLSTRTVNSFLSIGVKNLNEVLDLNDADLLLLPNWGKATVTEIRQCCKRHFGFAYRFDEDSLQWKKPAVV